MLRGTVGGRRNRSFSCSHICKKRGKGWKVWRTWVRKKNWETIEGASMGWKPKCNPCKIRGISLGWESRQKLGIIPKEEEDFLQRNLLSSFQRHLNHWEFLPRSSPLDYLSLAHKPPYTFEGPQNVIVEPRNTLQGQISTRHKGSMIVAFHP